MRESWTLLDFRGATKTLTGRLTGVEWFDV